MGNLVTKQFISNSTWTCPAGVASVNVVVQGAPAVPQAATGATLSLDAYGKIWSWGQNATSELGIGNLTPQSSPIAVLGGLIFNSLYFSGVSQQSALAIANNGQMYAWGANASGQLGIGSVVAQSSPVAVLGGLSFASALTCFGSSFGLTTTGALYGWGANTSGNLGIGNVTSVSSPVAVLGGLTFQSIAATAGGATFGITPSGVAYAWGIGANGILGTGSTTAQSSPVAVLGGLTFQAIVTAPYTGSGNSVFGLTTSGALYGWGLNLAGQLGVGDVLPRSSPVAVLGGLTFQQVLSGSNWTVGLTTAGRAYAWGSNTLGQLGIGNTTAQSSPVAVLGGLTFAKLFMEQNSGAVFGLTAAGVLYGWGLNSLGQLGVGNIVNQSSPVAVLGGLTFSQAINVDSSGSVFAIAPTGQMYAWGQNAFGQLGNGNVTGQSSPVAVLSGIAFKNQGIVFQNTFAVVPGTVYAINVGTFGASFGPNPIGYAPGATMTLTYQQ